MNLQSMENFLNLSCHTMALGVLTIGLLSGSALHAQSSNACALEISQMGYSIEKYSFEEGGLFSRDRHIFDDIVCEVNSKGEIITIERNGQVLAEDGVFGLTALQLREEAEKISAIRLAEARQQRNNAIADARAEFRATREEQRSRFNDIEHEETSHLEDLVQGLRDGYLDEAAARHFNIPQDFLDDNKYIDALRDRREQEREAEQARIDEEERLRQLESERKEEERRREEAAAEEREAAERQAREDALGLPIEPDNQIRGATNFPEDEVLQAARVAIEMINARGWTCNSISQVSPFWNANGVTIKCNYFRYHYELTDRGGNWFIEIK